MRRINIVGMKGMTIDELGAVPSWVRKAYTAPAMARKTSYPIVVYVPKYDSKLREEFEVKMTDDGKYELWVVQIGRGRQTRQLIGIYSDLDQVRKEAIAQFYHDFNRDTKGHPNVWQHSGRGRTVINSVSLHEGSKLTAPSATTRRTIEMERPQNIPTGGVHTIATRVSPAFLKKMSFVRKERTKRLIAKVGKSKGRHKP
jgi:hypothetical protein